MRGGDTATGQRPTVRQRQAAARREQILNTALKLFAAQGFDATSTRQIAKEAGIAEGLIFHYFPTKASLLTALLENRRSFRSELRAILDGAEDKPAPEVLREVASGWLATLPGCRARRAVHHRPDQPRGERSDAAGDRGRHLSGIRIPEGSHRCQRVEGRPAPSDRRGDVLLLSHDLLPHASSPTRTRVGKAGRRLRARVDLRLA